MVGIYDWPAECPDCENGSRAQAENRKFDGYVGKKKSANYVFQFPKGPAKRFSKLIGQPRYIEFVTGRKLVRAKVFEYSLDIGKALGEQSRKRRVWIGFEADMPSDAKMVRVVAKPVDGTHSHAFTVNLESRSVLVLTAREQPIQPARTNLTSR